MIEIDEQSRRVWIIPNLWNMGFLIPSMPHLLSCLRPLGHSNGIDLEMRAKRWKLLEPHWILQSSSFYLLGYKVYQIWPNRQSMVFFRTNKWLLTSQFFHHSIEQILRVVCSSIFQSHNRKILRERLFFFSKQFWDHSSCIL